MDCPPALGLLTINALAACNKVLITTTPQFFSAKGLGELLTSIRRARDRLNERIEVAGIVVTIDPGNTNISRKIIGMTQQAFGNAAPIFQTAIPKSCKIDESNYAGKPIQEIDPRGKVAKAYEALCNKFKGGAENG